MLVTLQPTCKSFCFTQFSVSSAALHNNNKKKNPFSKPQKFASFNFPVSLVSANFAFWGTTTTHTHLAFCSRNGESDGFSSTQVSQEDPLDDRIREQHEKLELLNKPSPIPNKDEEEEKEIKDSEQSLAPFLKFFKGGDSVEEVKKEPVLEDSEEKIDASEANEESKKKVNVEYYEPKPGDFVVGVVVSGNENKLDVNVGADLLGTMLTKEVLPLYGKETEYLLCDVNEEGAEKSMAAGKIGLVRDDDAISGTPAPGRPVVEIGTILFAEVLGRTLSGRPLLSTRRLFRRIAWHRVMQVFLLLFFHFSQLMKHKTDSHGHLHATH